MTNKINIGARIRELRSEKGLTQQALAGEFITRNMLSLIENGVSSPSLATLEYLAERLGIPMGYFFTSTPEEEKSYRKSAVMEELKRAYAARDYMTCTELCTALPTAYADDEISMIGAVSYMKAAVLYAERYAMSRASHCLSRASYYSNKTLYLDPSFYQALLYYTELFRSLNTDEIPEVLTDLAHASPMVPYEMILYFGILKRARRLSVPIAPYLNGTVQEKHIQAVMLMHEESYGKALVLLKALTQDASLPYFMRYRVYNDLESVSEKTGDLRSAYVSARKKLELMQKGKD